MRRPAVLALGALAANAAICRLDSQANADSCVTMKASVIRNACQACMKVTVRNLRQAADQSAAALAGEPRIVRIEAGADATLPADDRFVIVDIETCK